VELCDYTSTDGVTSPTLPLVDGMISLILFSVSKFEGQEKDHVLFRGMLHHCRVCGSLGVCVCCSGVVDGTSQDGKE